MIQHHPQLLNAKQVVFDLKKELRLMSPNGAIEFIELKTEEHEARVRFGLKINDLYKEMFPRKHRFSCRSEFSPDLEYEFYQQISKHYFPIDLSPFEEYGFRFLFPTIPVLTVQKFDWIQRNFRFDHLPLCHQLPLAILGRMGHDEFYQDLLLHLYKLPEIDIADPEEVDQDKFNDVCLSWNDLENQWLSYLHLSMAFVSYSTGNVWIDAHPIAVASVKFEWCKANIIKLATAWKKAMELYAHLVGFGKWLEEDPKTRIVECINLWNSCRKKN